MCVCVCVCVWEGGREGDIPSSTSLVKSEARMAIGAQWNSAIGKCH